MNRLAIFQDFCFWSTDEHTHKVDRWMVQFLLQHALPLQVKDTDKMYQDFSRNNNTGQELRSSARGVYTSRALFDLLRND